MRVLRFTSSAALLGSLPNFAQPSPLQPRQVSNTTAYIDFSVNTGEPQHLASGIIYGEPDTLNQIPDHFYTDIDLKYYRAGGAQLGAPSRGWIWNELDGRITSSLNNYLTARKYGGTFQLLIHDLWGTDGANSSTVWPGDNGDWTDYDDFLDAVVEALKANDMLPALQIDIWNEPDISIFWERSIDQWLDTYGRTYKRFRSDPDFDVNEMLGPTLAFRPQPSNPWWTSFLAYIVANDTVPDWYTWHLEGITTQLDNDLFDNELELPPMLAAAGAPERQYCVNEYLNPDEEVPSAAAFFISRFERYNVVGLRGNWDEPGSALHDYLAELVYGGPLNNESYYPNGQWQLYRYYATNMTGYRVQTTGSLDRWLDTYATVSEDKVRILVGTRLQTGTWTLTLENMSALGLPSEGSIDIQTWGFENGCGITCEVGEPSDRGVATHEYTGDTLSFPIYQTEVDNTTAWAFEFSP